MTDPIRYEVEEIDCCFQAEMIESHTGEYVTYSDYALLQTEIARLRKAGNVLAFHYIAFGRKLFPKDPLPSSVNEWNAAKDGTKTK